MNGKFTFLLLQLILVDQLADLPPPVESSRGQGWQFYISTIKANTGRSTGRSTTKQVESSQGEWEFYISNIRANIGRSTGRSSHQ